MPHGGEVEIEDLPAAAKVTSRTDSGYFWFAALSHGIVMWLAQAEAKARRNYLFPRRSLGSIIYALRPALGPVMWRVVNIPRQSRGL